MPIVKLTARNVLSLPAGDRRTEYVDEGETGLVLRVSRNGKRKYGVRYRPRRKDAQGNPRSERDRAPRRVSIGDARKLDLADARNEAAAIMGRVAKGHDPAGEHASARRVERSGADSFGRLAARLVAERPLAETTRRSWSWLIEKHIAPAIGRFRPSDVKRDDVSDLLAGIKSENVRQDVRKVVRWVYAWALEEGVVESMPALGRATKNISRDRRLTHAELRSVWLAAGKAGPYGAAVKLALLTGTRREEVFSATWGEIDREKEVWCIPAARVKNRVPHDVPLSQAAVELLETLDEDDEDRRLFRVRPTSKAWRALLVSAGIVTLPAGDDADDEGGDDAGESDDDDESQPKVRKAWTPNPIRFHDLRRTLRDSLTRDLRVSAEVAEAVIGHLQPKLVRTYNPSGVPLPDVRAALERWAHEVQRIVEAKPSSKLARMPRRS